MKNFIAFLFIYCSIAVSIAQPSWQDKVKWSFKIEKIDDSHANFIATAKLISGWHIFSVNHDPEKADFTGIPTSFNFPKNKNVKLIGKFQDAKPAHVFKDDLGTQLFFEGTGVFKQKLEILSSEKFKLNFLYTFQICDQNGCVFPPEQEGSIEISGFKPSTESATTSAVENEPKDTVKKHQVHPDIC